MLLHVTCVHSYLFWHSRHFLPVIQPLLNTRNTSLRYVEPIDEDDEDAPENEFVNATVGGSIPPNFIPAVEKVQQGLSLNQLFLYTFLVGSLVSGVFGCEFSKFIRLPFFHFLLFPTCRAHS